jgi:predicted dehydrogenase
MNPHVSSDPSRRTFLAAAGQSLLAAGVAGAADVPLAPPDKQPPQLPVPEGVLPKKTGWAIVGLGQLALEEVLPAFAESQACAPVALVSGHRDKATKVAERYGVDPKNIYDYADYDRIADNPAVDVIYIILPNSMHAEYTVRGLEAGKHVLCEKPMATSVAECEQMLAAADQVGRKLMVANRVRYEPHNQSVWDMARREAFGRVKLIEATNVQNTQAPNIRLSKSTGGGPLGDIGVYCIQACRWTAAEEPVEVTGWAQRNDSDPRFREVPEGVSFLLRFPSGVVAHCGVSFACETARRYRVHCTGGWMEVDNAFAYRGLKLRVGKEKSREEVEVREINQFAAEMDHFADCVRNNKTPWTPGEDGLIDMRICEAVERSIADGGRAVKLEPRGGRA